MPEASVDTAANALREALYVTVGFGVVGVQKLQVRRREAAKQVKSQAAQARKRYDEVAGSIDEQLGQIERRLSALENTVGSHLDKVQERLPDQAADLVKQARTAALEARDQVRSRINHVA